jgi:hypothetical protein
MKKTEYLIVMAIIAYIAFFTNPPPSIVSGILQSSIGRALVLLLILYVISYQSLIIGIFVGIAYIISASRVTEHLSIAPKIPVPRSELGPTNPVRTNDGRIPVPKSELGPTNPVRTNDGRIPVPKSELGPTNPVRTNDGRIPVPKSELNSSLSEEEKMAAIRKDIMEGRDTRITPDQLMGKVPIPAPVNSSIDFGALRGMDLSRPVLVSQFSSETTPIFKPNMPPPNTASPSIKRREGFGNFAAF